MNDWTETPPTATHPQVERKLPRRRTSSGTHALDKLAAASNQDIHNVVTTIPVAVEDVEAMKSGQSPEGSQEDQERKVSKLTTADGDEKGKKIKVGKLRNRKHSVTLKAQESLK